MTKNKAAMKAWETRRRNLEAKKLKPIEITDELIAQVLATLTAKKTVDVTDVKTFSGKSIIEISRALVEAEAQTGEEWEIRAKKLRGLIWRREYAEKKGDGR